MTERFDRRYLIVAGGFCIQGVMVGCLFAYGVFFKVLESDLGWSRTTLSMGFSLSFVVMGVVGMVAGRLSDRIGPRWVLSVAGLAFGLGLALLSRMSVPWHLYLFYGLLVGAGLSTHDVVTLSTVARWFDKRRGLMTGIVKIGTACGQMTIPLVAAVLIADVGWRTACMVLGSGAALILILAAQGMRRNPPVPAHANQSLRAAPVETGLSSNKALRTRQFWTLCAVQFAFIPSLVTIPVHLPVHGMDLGLSATSAAGLLSVIGTASIAGRALVGVGVDRLGGRIAISICLTGLVASLLILLAVETAAPLYLFAVVYGMSHGGLFTVVSPTLAEYFGTVAHGTIFGMVLFFGTLGGALGPTLAGVAFDQTGSYDLAFAGLALLAALGVVLILTLRPIAR